MAQIGEEREHPRPNQWETLSSTQGSQPQNDNMWNQSEEWGKSLNNDTEWKSDGWDTSSGRKEPAPHTRSRFSRCSRSRNVRSFRSPRGDLRQLIDIGTNSPEESLSPAHSGGNAPRYREPCDDLWWGSCSDGKKEASTSPRRSAPCSRREACQPVWGKRGEPSAGKQTGHPASADPNINENNWAENNPGNERSTHSLDADISNQGTSPVCNNITQVKNENQPGLSAPHNKLPDLSDENGHNGWNLHSPFRSQSRLRASSPFYQTAQEVKLSDVEKESDGWGLSSSHVDRSRLRSLSPWSQAADNTKETCKDTDGWGKALQPDLRAWNQAESIAISPNCGSNRWRSGHSASRSWDRSITTEGKWKRTEWDRRYSPENKWRKIGQHLDRSRCSERSVSPENRPSRTERGQGSSRGRGRSGLRSLSRLSRSEGISSTDTNKTKDEREKTLGFSSPKRNCSDLNEKTGSDRWDPTSPNADSFISKSLSRWSQVAPESTQNASQKEPDAWGQNSSPVKTSRSRSVSPWSQAAIDINKNYNNKETDGWGTALDRSGHDAWNQPRSNLSLDHGFKRSGGWESRRQSRSPAPKWGRTGRDHDRSRGGDNSYSPDSRQRRAGQIRSGSRYGGRGRTTSPHRCQNRSRRSPNLQRRKRRDPSYSPSGRSRTPKLQMSPSCVLGMDENREKRNGSEGKYYDKKTNDEGNAAKVTSWEGAKWHDWSVNAFRSSVIDTNLIFNWGGPTNAGDGNNAGANHAMTLHPEIVQSSTEWAVPGVGGNTMAIQDVYCETKHRAFVSQNSGDVKEKVVKNSPEIGHSMNGTTYLPLSYDPWDNDVCIASSHSTGALLVNPAASQTLSNQQNQILVSSLANNIFQTAPWSGSTNMLQKSSNSTWGPSTAPFKYPTLEPKTHIANGSSFSYCGGTKSNSLAIDGGLPHISMLNAATVSNGIDGVTTPPPNLAHFVADLPPLTSSAGIISSTPSAVPEARFSNSDAAMKLTLCTDTMRTSYSRGTVTADELSASNPLGHTSVDPMVGLPQTDQNAVLARFSKPNTDTVMRPISCTDMEETSRAIGSETKYESSAVNPVDPIPEVPKMGLSQPNQNPTVPIGMAERERTSEVDNHSFQWALISFAKPKLKPFWLERHLTDASYREVLDKFVKNVTRSLGITAPQTYENSCNYIKVQDNSLSNLLKDYLRRYMREDVINNTRYRRNDESLVFPT